MTPAVSRLGAALVWLAFSQPGTVAVVHYDARLRIEIGEGRVSGIVVLTAVGHTAASASLQLGGTPDGDRTWLLGTPLYSASGGV